ncbi:MAG: SCO family protein [Gammaproteobacteria bacterium]|nr:SCO family protein [Gammaproteobacteria bacterium]
MTRKRLAFVAFAVFDVLLVVTFVGLWFARANLVDERALAELGFAQAEQPSALGEFSLIDQHGNPFTRTDLLGKWQFIFFGFTSCADICPLTMQELEGLYRDLETTGFQTDTGVIMVSVDPLRDTPEAMTDFLQSYHPDFVGLTGDYPEIEGLASQLFIAFSQPGEHGFLHDGDDYVVAHSDYVAVVDPEGRYRGILHAPHRRERLMQTYLAIRDGS